MTSSSRGCGKVGIQRLLRDFQARWESRVLDFSSSRLFHSPSALRFVVCQGRTLGAVSAQPVRSMGEAVASVQVRSEEHTSELQSQSNLVCRLLLEKKKKKRKMHQQYLKTK